MARKRSCPSCRAKTTYEVEECPKCGYPLPWRRRFGIKGLSLVTVYERRVGGPLQIMWWKSGRPHRETLKNLQGKPVYDKELAIEVATQVSLAQRKKQEAKTAAQLLGVPEPHTVGELFRRMTSDRSPQWSEKWARDQRRYTKFWTNTLGPRTELTEVTPALVSRVVQKMAEAKGWSPKTQNHYLNSVVEAWSYAEKHLKWITPAQNLEAVRRHKVHVDNMDIAYSTPEVWKLLEVLPSIDLRAAVCAELSYMAGRRITAIRRLRAEAYRTEERIIPEVGPVEFGVVTFPAKTDKARKRGEVYLYGRPKDLMEELLATPAVQASGFLIPPGGLRAPIAGVKPLGENALRDWLRMAEERAGVDFVKGRSYHGFNRAFATDASNTRAASGQSGKTEETLRKIYRQPQPSEKALLAMEMEGERGRS